MDGLFLACLMGICGVPVAPGVPISTVQPAQSAAPLPPSNAATVPLAIEAPRATSQDASGLEPERPVPKETPVQEPSAGEGTATGGKASKADIAQVVRRKSAPIRKCYELGLIADPRFKGTVEVQWRIGVDGRVSSANIVSSSLKNRATETCLLAEILRWEFAPSAEPVVVGSYPFTFDSTLLARRSVPEKPAVR